MHILAALKPNNKFQIKRYRLADGYGRSPSRHDPSCLTRIEQEGFLLEKIHSIDKTLQNSEEIKYRNILVHGCKQLDIFGGSSYDKSLTQTVAVPYCDIAGAIEVYEPSPKGDGGGIRSVSYLDLARERVATLDLLKKSQRTEKKHTVWGAPTKLKDFRWQAAEKILEGGSIIDRFLGAKKSTMVTMTLPGNNWYAFDALARWSGWIVNRITQVIRRNQYEDNRPYWFFVWEHQKRGALHMHWCIAWDVPRSEREELCRKIVGKWFGLLEEITNNEGIDMFAQKGFMGTHRYNPGVWQWDIQQIDNSVAAYFAKYCSKNVELSPQSVQGRVHGNNDKKKKNRQRTTSANRTCPSRYWGCSQTVKQWSKRLTKRRSFVVDNRESANGIAHRIREMLPGWAEYKSVSVVPFEVIDPITGICISSGVTESYVVEGHQFPEFHKYVCEEILEYEYRMDAMDKQFLASMRTHA